MAQPTDQQLVQAALATPDDFAHIIDRYQAKLNRYIQRLGIQTEQAREDILQEAFIKVYINLNGYNPALSFNAWIYRITHNETINYIRKQKRQALTFTDEDSLIIFQQIAAEGTPASETKTRLTRETVQKLLNKLPENYRHALILRYIEDLDYQTIADIMKKPIGSIATLVRRAKQQLLDYCERHNLNLTEQL